MLLHVATVRSTPPRAGVRSITTSPAFALLDALAAAVAPQADRAAADAGVSDARWSPALDLAETDDAYLLTLDVPGASREAITITARDGRLVIEGQRSATVDARHRERWAGSFRRVLRLPVHAALDATEATLTDGVLSLRVPKRPDARARTIPIGTATPAA